MIFRDRKRRTLGRESTMGRDDRGLVGLGEVHRDARLAVRGLRLDQVFFSALGLLLGQGDARFAFPRTVRS